MSEASTQYKKQDGKLFLSLDGKTVSWKPNNASISSVTILVSEIANLQQTPEKSAKVSIKFVVQKPSTSEPENHTFTFTSPSARAEQLAITGSLRKSIEIFKAQNAAKVASPADNSGGQPAALAIAQSLSTGARAEENPLSDSRLLANGDLQRSLLSSDPALSQRFNQAFREKPDSISIIQFAAQFWATRVHLLRSHAVEKQQSQGTYNVLSEVKPKNVDGTTKLNLSKEQIQLIFNQHPLVKMVYNENVPQLSEMDFWARFFVSRLFKKLKGEKVTETDSIDPKLDKYLNFDDDADRTRQLTMSTVPHFIDLEGNEQNHSQRRGNRPDVEMQPNSHEKVPILRVLNQMSEKMMADVPPSDVDLHTPAGMDEEKYKELQLRDLQRAAEDSRIILKIQNQGQLFSAEQGVHSSSDASTYAKRTPAQVISLIRHDVRSISAGKSKTHEFNLESGIGVVEEESSSDEDTGAKKRARVGSRSARTAATAQIINAVGQRHLHDDDYLSSRDTATSEQAAKMGLSKTVFDTLAMTHNTAVEFLHYFWAVFLSGNADRAGELEHLVGTLSRSIDRVQAVADSAEKERKAKMEKLKKDYEILAQKGKRRKFDPNSIKGGAKAVNTMMSPLVRAIDTAQQHYRKAYQAQSGQITN
ncbi:RNA polymerase II transcription factor [Zopfia rhizophila CBS 207.26]|uniref:RNA polymerase II transcription factor n=1 Tax=Zopfia rhizophila CBS 207.26 TaxID=1314779 RepID=A0A6A6DGS5_9PEZI|nr:RNA polymerase II transcription factor [Zopfia rhizophila CBS 207.26]